MNTADTLFREGLLAHRQGQLEIAQSFYQKALLKDDQHAEALHLSGVICIQSGDWQSGMDKLEASLAVQPNNPMTHNNLGNALLDQNIHERAIEHYDIAISLNPQYAQPHLGLGQAFRGSGRPFAATASLVRAIQLKPDLIEARLQLALTQAEVHNFESALKQLSALLTQLPGHAACLQVYSDIAKAHNLHLLRLQSLVGRNQMKDVEAIRTQAQGLYLKKRITEAIELLNAAIVLDPQHARTYYNKGICHGTLRQFFSAIECYDRATNLDPKMDEAWHNCGSALFDIQQYSEAIRQFDKAIELTPQLSHAILMKLYAKQSVCDWSDWWTLKKLVLEHIALGHCPVQPLPILALTDSGEVQLQAARSHFQETLSGIKSTPFSNRQNHNQRIKVGYFSQDFRNHAVAFLTSELFELHNREQFEVHGFYFGKETNDDSHQRLKAGFEHFHDVRELTDQGVVDLSRQLKLDIAVDLSGYTLNNRNGIFSLRLAPVQINYIGYPGTMGHPEIDYIVGDSIVIPESHKHFYSEKIICLPCFQVNDRKRVISDRVFTREELGIPQGHFVFCGINAPHKLSPEMMSSWMDILRQVPYSVLMLFKEHDQAEHNLRTFATAQNVNPDRLIFVTRLSPADNLARYRVADLFLDIFPFNGGTTVSDALWAGLPVLTCSGEAFASRMASSLLSAVGLSALITTDLNSYVTKAVELASTSDRMSQVKQQLASNKDSCILFNTPLFTAKLEAAFKIAHRRYLDEQQPSDIQVH